jgi:hypothetical protein
VVIGGTHPEFSFEHDADNVRQAVRRWGSPIRSRTDNDYAVWLAFGNHYWPALYFADARGASGITTSVRAPTASRRW